MHRKFPEYLQLVVDNSSSQREKPNSLPVQIDFNDLQSLSCEQEYRRKSELWQVPPSWVWRHALNGNPVARKMVDEYKSVFVQLNRLALS